MLCFFKQYPLKTLLLKKRLKVEGKKPPVPVCSLTTIPKMPGTEFTAQRRAVHLRKQIMAPTPESAPLEELGAHRAMSQVISIQ